MKLPSESLSHPIDSKEKVKKELVSYSWYIIILEVNIAEITSCSILKKNKITL
jgi:hypothetical protein